MRKYLMTATLVAGFGAAGAAMAGDDCRVPKAEWQPQEAVQAMAGRQGWTLRSIATDDGCYEVMGSDARGRDVKAKLDPATLAIVKLKYGDGECRVPMADWQPREAVQTLAKHNGWAVQRIKIDDGCYKILGRDGAGRKIEIALDPATLAVVETGYEFEEGDPGRFLAPGPAGTDGDSVGGLPAPDGGSAPE